MTGLVALSLVTGPAGSAAPAELFFNTTFSFPSVGGYGIIENTEYGVPNPNQPNRAEVLGYDTAISGPNNWGSGDGKLENSFGTSTDNPGVRTGRFKFEYDTPDYAAASATIVNDPENSANKVLKFTLNDGVVDGNPVYGRVQADLYGNQNWREFFYTVRMYIPATSLKKLEELSGVFTGAPNYSWVTLAEFWNQTPWEPQDDVSNPSPSRVTFGLTKPSALPKTALRFEIIVESNAGQNTPFIENWKRVNQTVDVPYDTWFTLEFYLKEGGIGEGLVYATITPDQKPKQLLFNYRASTRNTSTNASFGYANINPLKLYTSDTLIDFVKSQDGKFEVYFDDWKLWYGTMATPAGFYNPPGL